jgi:hypothetical protein
MGGLYITDNLEIPLKFQIPVTNTELTTIPSKGYKLFWADGQPEQGVLHLNFKLDRDGEQIGLVQLMDNYSAFIDSLSYSIQKTDTSAGRYYDGANTWFSLLPTPLEPNQLLPAPVADAIKEAISMTGLRNCPNPFSNKTVISYTTQERSNVTLNICDVSGRKICTLVKAEQPAGSYEVEWKVESMNPGIYFCELNVGQYKEFIKMVLLE